MGSTGASATYGSVTLNFTRGSIGGEEAHQLTVNEMPTHSHSVTDPGHSHSLTLKGLYNNGDEYDTGGRITYVGSNQGGAFTRSLTTNEIGATGTNVTIQDRGSGNAFNNTPAYQTVNFIIKFQ
jgi:microcystin-dependent protein